MDRVFFLETLGNNLNWVKKILFRFQQLLKHSSQRRRNEINIFQNKYMQYHHQSTDMGSHSPPQIDVTTNFKRHIKKYYNLTGITEVTTKIGKHPDEKVDLLLSDSKCNWLSSLYTRRVIITGLVRLFKR